MGLLPELLYAYGASNDHMEALIADIAILMTRIGAGSANKQLSLELRRGCAAALRGLLQKMDAPISAWFHAMALLDLYCHSKGNVDRQDIQCVCMAIAIIIGKLEGEDISNICSFVNNGEQMLKVYRKEEDILESVQFRIRIPTIESWMNIFLPRLHLTIIDTKFVCLVSQLAKYYSKQFVIQHVCLPDSKLQHFTRGLIGVACIAAARMSGAPITQLRETPEALQTALVSCIGEDIGTLENDADMVNNLLHGMLRPPQQSSLFSI
jgi:hypothetical protein